MRRTLARLDEVDQFLGAWPGAFAHDDDSRDRLAPFVVGHADNGDHRDIGVLGQHVLDLARKDVEPAGDDHVLLAVEDEHVAALVRARDIAGMQPAVLQGFRGLLRPLPVSGHHMRRAHADLAGLSGFDFTVVVAENFDVAGGDRKSAGQEEIRSLWIMVRLAQHRDRIALGLSV